MSKKEFMMVFTKNISKLGVFYVFLAAFSTVFAYKPEEVSNSIERALCKQCNKVKQLTGFDITIAQPIIGQSNSMFIDACGRVAIFHGMNIMNKVEPWFIESYYNPDGSLSNLAVQTAQFWVENGFNTARVGIAWAGVEPFPGQYNDNYIKKIQKLIHLFGEYGIFSVLDFHQDQWSPTFCGNQFPEWAANTNDANGNPVPNTCVSPTDCPFPTCSFPFGIFQNAALLQVWDNFWNDVPAVGDTVGVKTRFLNMIAHTMGFFSGEKYLLTIESINEPGPSLEYYNCTQQQCGNPVPCGGTICPGFMCVPPSNSIINIYDTHNPDNTKNFRGCQEFDLGELQNNNLVIVQGNNYAKFKEQFTQAVRSVDKKHIITLGLPFYELGNLLPIISEPTDSNVCFSTNAYGIQGNPPIGAFGQFLPLYTLDLVRANAKLFGATTMIKEVGAGNNDPLSASLTLLDRRQTSWNYWPYWQGFFNDSTAVLINPNLPPTNSNINEALLNQIVRPYPRVIAGTPIAYSYDNADIDNKNGVFTLEYSKCDPKGCREISSKLLTEISVTSRNYPNGYIAKVTGARVVSKEDSPLLLIKRCKNASKVTVIVSPR